jgi:hypothetical protein
MSEENTEVQETEDVEGTEETQGDNDSDLTVDDYKRMVASLRKENAKHRTKNVAKEEELAEFRKWKDSQLTELERAQKRVAELEAKQAERELVERQRSIAKKAGLDESLADRIRGESDEDMLADAKAMALLFGAEKDGGSGGTTAPDFFGGPGGKKHVSASGKDQAGWFEQLYNG